METKTRTVREWINLVKDDELREKLFTDVLKYNNEHRLDKTHPSLYDAIFWAVSTDLWKKLGGVTTHLRDHPERYLMDEPVATRKTLDLEQPDPVAEPELKVGQELLCKKDNNGFYAGMTYRVEFVGTNTVRIDYHNGRSGHTFELQCLSHINGVEIWSDYFSTTPPSATASEPSNIAYGITDLSEPTPDKATMYRHKKTGWTADNSANTEYNITRSDGSYAGSIAPVLIEDSDDWEIVKPNPQPNEAQLAIVRENWPQIMSLLDLGVQMATAGNLNPTMCEELFERIKAAKP